MYTKEKDDRKLFYVSPRTKVFTINTETNILASSIETRELESIEIDENEFIW